MKKRAFSLASLFLILIAIFLHMGGFGAAAEKTRNKNNAMNTADVQKQQGLYSEANRLSHRSDMLIMSGWGLAVAGVICLYLSYRRDESASRAGQIILLAFYVLLQFGTV
ncbi:MAG: hypothetical protein PHY43_05555 [Verrucomicrobiales bacterium]|nr:hypothetical protein [Verrucomicrobiales bacterium]